MLSLILQYLNSQLYRFSISYEDVESLQDDLEKLYSWQTHNNMVFNGKKFEMLRYGKDKDLKTKELD